MKLQLFKLIDKKSHNISGIFTSLNEKSPLPKTGHSFVCGFSYISPFIHLLLLLFISYVKVQLIITLFAWLENVRTIQLPPAIVDNYRHTRPVPNRFGNHLKPLVPEIAVDHSGY